MSNYFEQHAKEQVFDKEIVALYTEEITIRVQASTADYGTDDGRSGFLFIKIQCTPPFKKEEPYHPFMLSSDHPSTETVEYIQTIIADNEYSRTLLEWIAKSDEELEKKCGSADPNLYRAKLIDQISRMWD